MAKPHAIQSGLGCSDAGARVWETNSSCLPHARYIVLHMFFCDRLAVVFTCYQSWEHQWPKIPWVFTAEVKSAKSAIAGRHQARFIENFLAHFMNGTITSLYASSPETQIFICLVGGGFFHFTFIRLGNVASLACPCEQWPHDASVGWCFNQGHTRTHIYIDIIPGIHNYTYTITFIHTYIHKYVQTYLFASFLPSFLPSLHTYLTLLNLT